jgi:hypothetical protein
MEPSPDDVSPRAAGALTHAQEMWWLVGAQLAVLVVLAILLLI